MAQGVGDGAEGDAGGLSILRWFYSSSGVMVGQALLRYHCLL
jgi:hypothetical protein